MAAATVTTVVKNTWFDYVFSVFGSVSVQAGPATYVAGGLPFPLNDPQIKAQRLPMTVEFFSTSGNIYAYQPGATLAAGKLKIFTAAGTELTAIAIPAGNSNDTITFFARFLGMN